MRGRYKAGEILILEWGNRCKAGKKQVNGVRGGYEVGKRGVRQVQDR